MIEDKVIVDASFIVNLLGLNGVLSRKKAHSLVEDKMLIAPRLIEYEVGNVFLKYKNIDTKFLFETFELLDIEFIDIVNKQNIFDISKKHNISYYDASYYELFFSNDGVLALYTYDKDFKKIKDSKIKFINL